jgi:iron complex transport system ATP-binding protein
MNRNTMQDKPSNGRVMRGEPLRLFVEDVSWSVDERRIVDSVLLDVQPGEFVGLIGPNGSGKSSLLRTIYRVLQPDVGVITLNGDDVWAMHPREAARRTAVVTQERTSEFDFTVHEMVMMGRNPHKGLFDSDTQEDFVIVNEALARVGMADFAERIFNTLSGGEKQRVLVARALAQQARLLVLDEPTNHLDIRYQLEILTLVKGLGVTALAALHDLNLAAAYCNRLYLLSNGRIATSGAPAEVLTPDWVRSVYGVDAHCGVHPITGQLHLVFMAADETALEVRTA